MYVQDNQRVTVAIFRANFSFLVKVKFNPVHFYMIAYIRVVFHLPLYIFLLPVKTIIIKTIYDLSCTRSVYYYTAIHSKDSSMDA